jgi:hypothetical protein
MNKYLNDFTEYFKYLCEQHPDLLHAETAGDRVFEVVAYDEAFSDFRSVAQEKGYFVRFILPTMRFERKDNNARKVYQAGLMVGKYYSRREADKTAIVIAWADAERVADDFIARMIADSNAGYSLFSGTINTADRLNLQGDFWDVQGDGSYAAVVYFFDMGAFRCIDPNGGEYAAWVDGGLTE